MISAQILWPGGRISPILASMSADKLGERGRPNPWTSFAAKLLRTSESVVLILIGVALVFVAVLLLYSSMHDLGEAVRNGPAEIGHKAIEILNTVLLVMMTMEIAYTVAISLESHTLNAEPFLIIGVIASIRRMLVITATSTEVETHPEQFHNTLAELGLLAATVVALAAAIWIFRYSAHRNDKASGKAQQVKTD
jgi:phosphate starvation-inducible membrane PsiE